MTDEIKERLEQQAKKEADQADHNRGQEANLAEAQRRTFSASFFERLTAPDIEPEGALAELSPGAGVEPKLPSLLSSTNVVGRRHADFNKELELLNRGRAKQVVSEHDSGSLLRRQPGIHAVLRGEEPRIERPPTSGRVSRAADAVPADLSPEQRRALRSAIRDIATQLGSMSVSATGLRQFTSATSERHTVTHDDDDSGLISRASGGIFG